MKCMYKQSKRGLPSDVRAMALRVDAVVGIDMEYKHGGEDAAPRPTARPGTLTRCWIPRWPGWMSRTTA